MKKRILAALFAAMLVVSLAACGNKNEPEVEDEGPYFGELALFDVPKIGKNKATIVAELPLNAGGNLIYKVEIEQGEGFFVACSKQDKDTVDVDKIEWFLWEETDSNELYKEMTIEIEEEGMYYFYVGSTGGEIYHLNGAIDWTVPNPDQVEADYLAAQANK